MEDCLIACALGAPPPGALPPWGGVVECAEEHGLVWFRPIGPRLHPLPTGVLWGRFHSPREALQAFDRAIDAASELLGYPIAVNRRVVRLG